MAEGLTNWFCWVPFFEYECLNTHSFKDCDLKRYSVTCLNSQHCVTSSVKITSGTNNEGYVKGCASTCSASDQFQQTTNSTSSVKLVVVILTSAMEPQREPRRNHQGEPLGDSQPGGTYRESPSGTLMGGRRTSFGKSLESYGLRDSTNCHLHCQPYVLVQMLTKLRLRSGEKIPPGYHDHN